MELLLMKAMLKEINMNKQDIDRVKLKFIIKTTYQEIRNKNKNNTTKSAAIANIMKVIEETLKDGD